MRPVPDKDKLASFVVAVRTLLREPVENGCFFVRFGRPSQLTTLS
jgi:hypothetical protein